MNDHLNKDVQALHPLSDTSYSRTSQHKSQDNSASQSQSSHSRSDYQEQQDQEGELCYTYENQNKILDTDVVADLNKQSLFMQSSMKSQSNEGTGIIGTSGDELNCFKFLSQTKDNQSKGEMDTHLRGKIMSQQMFYSDPSLSPEKSAQKEASGFQKYEERQNEIFSNKNLFVGCIIKDTKPAVLNQRGRSRDVSSTMKRSSSFSYQKSKSPLCNKKQEFQSQTNADKGTNLDLFTTQDPSSYLIQASRAFSGNLIKAFFKQPNDLQTFIHAFDSQASPFKLFLFDQCLNEGQGHNYEAFNKNLVSFLQSKNNQSVNCSRLSEPSSNYSNLDNDKPNDFVFLFGQHHAKKSDLFNPINQTSILNYIVTNLKEPVKFVRVSMIYLDQEYTLIQKSYQNQHSNQQSLTQEFWMDLRQSQRNRHLIIKKLQGHKQLEKESKDIKYGSHLIIQVNHLILMDLANIECLNKASNPQLIQSLTMNFSSITNEILKLSRYYQNHQFQVPEEQEHSQFTQYLRQYFTDDSKIILLCCVSSQKELMPQTEIALDYCQKIKCYFNGVSEEELQQFMIKDSSQFREDSSQIKLLGQLCFDLSKLKQKVTSSLQNKQPNKKSYLKQLHKLQAQAAPHVQREQSNHSMDFIQFLNLEFRSLAQLIENKRDSLGIEMLTSRTPMKKSPYQSNSTNNNLTTTNKKSHSRKRSVGGGQSSAYRSFRENCNTKNIVIINDKKKSASKKKQQTNRVQKYQAKQNSKIINSSNSVSNLQMPNMRQTNSALSNHLEKSGSQLLTCQTQDNHKLQETSQSHIDDAFISRDTPQFVDDNQFQSSSLYLRTSAASSHLNSKHKILTINKLLNQQNSGQNSQFTSIGGQMNNLLGSLYYNTEQSIEAREDPILHAIDNGDKVLKTDLSATLSKLQDRLKSALSDNESLNNLKIIYEKQIFQLQQQATKLQQTSTANQKPSKVSVLLEKKIEELQFQVTSQDTLISALQSQNQSYKQDIDLRESELQNLKQELANVKKDRDTQKEMNESILAQIGTMKGMIQEFKGRENEKSKYIEKIKIQEHKIKNLKDQVEKMENQTLPQKHQKITDDRYKKLQEENMQLAHDQAQKIQDVETKFQTLFVDYKRTLEDNQELAKKVNEQEVVLRQIEKAKENYKDQTIDLKQEIKHLKKLQKENSENIENMRFEAKERQKSMVLGDIKNLIKDYKNEKKLNSSISKIN